MNLTRWALVAVVLLVACAGKDTVSDSFDDQAMTDVADDVLDVNEEVQDLDIVQDIQNDLGDIQDASDLAGDDVAGDELGDDLGDELGDDLDDTEEPTDLPPPDLDPVQPIIPDWQRARQVEFLTHSCSIALNGANPMHLLAHLACEQLPGFPEVPADSVPLNAFDAVFEKMYRLRDTSDFDATRLINLLYAVDEHPALPAELRTRIEDALLSFKYWYTDPTPEREFNGEPVVDKMWYWSENHILIFRTVEYLMGQRFPDRIFTVTGENGAWHRKRARAEIIKWLDERAHWGFTEWHSDVYYNWDLNPLISLIEWADDEEIVKRASMVLDLFWLDVALHLHRGNFGATHGRSYIKDKPAAIKQDTFWVTKLFFDDTDIPWIDAAPGSTVLFARSQKYVMPYAIRAVALHDQPFEGRQRMNLPLPEEPPGSCDAPVPPPPYGLSYTEEHLPLWWSMGAITAWPVLPLTLEVANRYNLWEGQLDAVAQISEYIDLTQPIEDVLCSIFFIYQAFWRAINSGLLTEVYTKTFKTPHSMLSSVQDYRKGNMAMQVHAWQATLSESAVVFTNLPGTLPVNPGDPVPPDWDWQKSDEHGSGYWTGDGALPRIAQHRDVAIILYAPQFPSAPLNISQFAYRDETHAYFPHAHFDEVVQKDGWTFGRKDDGYVGLWSHQPTSWRTGQPEVFENGGLPFDLVAEGAQNAWIAQIGDVDEWGSFAAFMDALSSASITVKEVPDADDDGFGDGFSVAYEAAGRGTFTFSWHDPFKLNGESIPLTWRWRYDNPFVRTTFNRTRYHIVVDDHELFLDFESDSRLATKAPQD
ncbi:MAG TPA: hypothetical protein PLC97_00340 [Myxococcota bacterium]|mgnify:FL=1|nr:hypothetical protein [Myxococcota bacterium]